MAKLLIDATRFFFLCAALLALPAVAAAQPAPPADLTVGAIITAPVTRAIKVTWSDRSTDETGFEVFNGNETRQVSAGATDYIWGGLIPDQYMCFRVRSFNSSGFSSWMPENPPYYRCAVTPKFPEDLLAFPISGDQNACDRLSGVQHCNIGSLGLHDHNFRAVTDDISRSNIFTFTNWGPDPNDPYSLDFISPADTPVHSARAGTVLAVQAKCEIVVVNSDDLWFVYVHVIPRNGLRAGDRVGRGTSLGTVSPNTYPNDHPGPCGLVSDATHVHLAIAQPQGGNDATYVTLQDRYFCGHRVIKVDNDNTNVIIEGLTHEKMQAFRVPQCWEPTISVPAAPSSINLAIVSDGTGIEVNWNDNSNNEEGFDISYSPTQDNIRAKHDLTFPNQTFLSSSWELNDDMTGLLLSGQKMCFQVSAYNAAGSSAPTPWSCITVP